MKLVNFNVGADQPFFLIAGPCVIESESLALETAGSLKEITDSSLASLSRDIDFFRVEIDLRELVV